MAVIRIVPTVVILSVGILILAIGIVILPVFNKVLHNEIDEMIPLTKDSKTLATWEDPRDSVDMYMKFYFFDITNADDVVNNGSKPNLKQKGPYVYNEIKVKKNVTFDAENSTVTYRQPRSWVFNRSASAGNEDETFTALNVPLYAIVTVLQSMPELEKLFSDFLPLVRNASMFRTLSVKDLLWGYKDNLLSDIGIIVKVFHIKLPVKMNLDGNFGFFYQKNGTDDGLYTVNTGQKNLNDFMQVETWNNDSYVHYWKTEYCNMVNGTDGTMYHPFLDKKEKLFLFSSDLCRSIHVEYDSEIEYQDVPLYHYLPPASMFDYHNVDNQCYCVGEHCPHSGCLNISQCQQGAPVFVSQPHFLNGDYYLQQVTGLSPNASLHNTFIDVEPTSGIVMRGAKRLQMNIDLHNISLVDEAKNLPALLLPLLWLEESACINDKGMKQFKDEFFDVEEWVFFSAYLCMSLGGAVIVFVCIYIGVSYYRAHQVKKQEKNKVVASSSGSEPNERTHLLNKNEQTYEDDKDWSSMMGNETYTD